MQMTTQEAKPALGGGVRTTREPQHRRGGFIPFLYWYRGNVVHGEPGQTLAATALLAANPTPNDAGNR
jgi:hypothetical protein